MSDSEEDEVDTAQMDEDALLKERTLGSLENQLKKLFGFDSGAFGLVQLDASALHTFLGDLGEKLAQHDALLVSPPWLECVPLMVSDRSKALA